MLEDWVLLDFWEFCKLGNFETLKNGNQKLCQDYDSVLCGAKRLVRNFTSTGRRKIPNRNTYIDVVPEIIETQKTLDAIGLTREELIDVGILIGTDFNPNGFERIGPKSAM